MATLKQAEQARDQFADSLAAQGAHAIGVEETGDLGWVVVAFVLPDSSATLPDSLKLRVGDSTVDVPLKVERQGAFRPE